MRMPESTVAVSSSVRRVLPSPFGTRTAAKPNVTTADATAHVGTGPWRTAATPYRMVSTVKASAASPPRTSHSTPPEGGCSTCTRPGTVGLVRKFRHRRTLSPGLR